jgi:hypothetical protein
MRTLCRWAHSPKQSKMGRWIIFALMFIITISVHGQKIIKGDIEYSVATYSDELFVDKKYGAFLDSLLKKPLFEHIRDTDIKNLPTNDKDKPKGLTPSESHVIEPLFINIKSFNGIYAKRIWSLDPKARAAVRFRCGFYHQLFILSDNKYIELSKDTLKNEKLIRNLMAEDFTDGEILRMTNYFKYNTICEHYTFLPSFYIKKDDEVVFDAEKIKKSN